MKCQSCGGVNDTAASFCKYCSAKLNPQLIKCKNGHDYDPSMRTCPHCPSENASGRSSQSNTNDKTEMIGQTLGDKPTVSENAGTDRTAFNNQDSYSDERTVFMRPGDNQAGKSKAAADEPKEQRGEGGRKLIGWIVTFDTDDNGKDFRIFEGKNRIGRSVNNDIILPMDSVSKDHCIIQFRNGRLWIYDTHSENGTFVNDVDIETDVTLKDFDKIRVGSVNFKLRVI